MLSDTNPPLGAEGLVCRVFCLLPSRDSATIRPFMGRTTTSAPRSASEPASLEDAVVDLGAEVSTLSQHVEVLRIAIDDLRQELEFAIRNMPREPWVPTQPVISMPRDPLSDSFPVNPTRREDVPVESIPPSPSPEPPPPLSPAIEAPVSPKNKRQKAELF